MAHKHTKLIQSPRKSTDLRPFLTDKDLRLIEKSEVHVPSDIAPQLFDDSDLWATAERRLDAWAQKRHKP